MVNFTAQVVVTVLVAYMWHRGGPLRGAAGFLLVASGADGAFDIVPFALSGDMLAASVELMWIALGVYACWYGAKVVRGSWTPEITARETTSPA